MANVDLRKGTSTGKGTANLYGKPVKTVYTLIDLVKAAAVKGSALATGDVIQALRIPIGTRVLFAGAKVIEACDATTLNFNVGTSGDAARFVAAGIGAWSQPAGTFAVFAGSAGTLNIANAAESINVTIGTFTGTVPTTGVLAVFADIADYSEFAGANINATDQAGVPQA